MLELKTLKTLLPQKCRAWFVREGYILDLFTGIATSFQDFREWLEDIKLNSFPATAEESLPEWFKEYGIEYIESDSVDIKRNKILTKRYQIGALNKEYILFTLKKIGLTNVDIIEGIFDDENSCGYAECGDAQCGNWFSYYGIVDGFFGYYIVYGSIDTESQRNMLQNTCNEIVRAILEPIWNFNVTTGSIGSLPYQPVIVGDKIWSTVYNAVNNLVEINTDTAEILSQHIISDVYANEKPWGMAYDGTYLWIAIQTDYDGKIIKFDPITKTIVNTLLVGRTPWSVLYYSGYIWVSQTSIDGNYIYKINPSTDTIVATITMPYVSVDMVMTAFNDTLCVALTDYSSTYYEGKVCLINTTTNTIIDTVATSRYIEGLTNDGTYLWISYTQGSGGFDRTQLCKYDIVSKTIIQSYTIVEKPHHMFFYDGYIWICNYDANYITKFDPNTGERVKIYYAGNKPVNIAFYNGFAWCANWQSSTNGRISKVEL